MSSTRSPISDGVLSQCLTYSPGGPGTHSITFTGLDVICSPGWPQTLCNLPAAASQGLEAQLVEQPWPALPFVLNENF